MSKLSSKQQELLDAVRKDWGPGPAVTEAVRAAIPARIVAEPALGPAGPGPAAPAPLLRGPFGIGFGVVVVGLCVAGALWVRGSAPAPFVATPAAQPTTFALPAPGPAPSADPQPVAVSLDSLPNAAAPLSPASAARPAASPSAPSNEDSLAEELALLRKAQAAQRAGDPNGALQTLTTHAARFPRGALREERMTLQVLALCDRGDVAEAVNAMAELAKIAPGSSHLHRLSTSCAASR
ncbi:MAG TPA: hypothetical protein VLT33_10580 [Labilithrix sp.]|nr:hypothetical protein [Labilithrix sp.]